MTQQLNFHKRQFKAYLALRGLTKADVARKIGMDIKLFQNKSVRSIDHRTEDKEIFRRFNEDECKQIAKILGMSDAWQRRIFSKVILK